MRPHPQIAPYIRRPSRTTAELVVQMAPENGDPVPSLVIPLDARAGTRMLAELLDVFRSAWIEASPACDPAGMGIVRHPQEKDGISHERTV